MFLHEIYSHNLSYLYEVLSFQLTIYLVIVVIITSFRLNISITSLNKYFCYNNN